MAISLQDVARLQPASDALNIILKNTHFKDDILAEKAKIHLRIDYSMTIPILVFTFSEPFYDFWEVVKLETLTTSNEEWLNKSNIIIKLIMSETVITDRLSTREFILSESETNTLREEMIKQKSFSAFELETIEAKILSNFRI